MKKPILVAGGVIAFLLLTYFTMWFFLCQTFAIKINTILTPIYSTIGTKNGDAFVKNFNASKDSFIEKYGARDQDVFIKSISSVFNDYSNKFDSKANFDDLKTKVLELNYMSDMINIALGRALYIDKSVPLGAMRKSLLVYSTTFKSIEETLDNNPDTDLTEKPIKSYRDYQYILDGKENVLRGYLKGGMKKRIMIALEQIDRDKIKKLSEEVAAVFKTTSDLEIKFTCIKTFFALSQPKNADMDKFLMGILAQKDIPIDAIELAGQTYNRDYMPFLIVLTNNNTKQDVRDAALTAISRMQVK